MAHGEIELILVLTLYLANLLSSSNNSDTDAVTFPACQRKKILLLANNVFCFFSLRFYTFHFFLSLGFHLGTDKRLGEFTGLPSLTPFPALR